MSLLDVHIQFQGQTLYGTLVRSVYYNIHNYVIHHLSFSDGHHKLVRWCFVTHCGIDGYSRLVVYLKCSTNNNASTVYEAFIEATTRYGIPSHVRCDQGRENMHTCLNGVVVIVEVLFLVVQFIISV